MIHDNSRKTIQRLPDYEGVVNLMMKLLFESGIIKFHPAAAHESPAYLEVAAEAGSKIPLTPSAVHKLRQVGTPENLPLADPLDLLPFPEDDTEAPVPERYVNNSLAIEALIHYIFLSGDVLLDDNGSSTPSLIINNTSGTEISISRHAADILEKAGIPTAQQLQDEDVADCDSDPLSSLFDEFTRGKLR